MEGQYYPLHGPPVCQGVPEISTLPWFTLFTPFVCLLVIRATRDLVDDIVSGVEGQLGRELGTSWGPFLAAIGAGTPRPFGPCCHAG